jgi:low affinity Fe/Cu permease
MPATVHQFAGRFARLERRALPCGNRPMQLYIKPHSWPARKLERVSHLATRWTGTSWAFAIAALVVIGWLLTGPLFGYSDTWQLVINTSTTVVTFLMVFLIQRAQNKDSMAVQLKLNEIVAALEGASNRLIDIEELGEEELEVLHRHYQRLAEIAKSETDVRRSHSVDEASARHHRKARASKLPPQGG